MTCLVLLVMVHVELDSVTCCSLMTCLVLLVMVHVELDSVTCCVTLLLLLSHNMSVSMLCSSCEVACWCLLAMASSHTDTHLVFEGELL